MWNASGKAIGGVIAANKVNATVKATVSGGDSTIGGDLGVQATDSAGIHSNVKIVSSSVTTNTGGTAVLQDQINKFLPADYLSSEGERHDAFGDRVRVAADYDSGPGHSQRRLRLHGQRRASSTSAPPTTPTSAPGSRCPRPSWSRRASTSRSPTRSPIGGTVVLNDVRSDVARLPRRRDRRRRRASRSALETATIAAVADVERQLVRRQLASTARAPRWRPAR